MTRCASATCLEEAPLRLTPQGGVTMTYPHSILWSAVEISSRNWLTRWLTGNVIKAAVSNGPRALRGVRRGDRDSYALVPSPPCSPGRPDITVLRYYTRYNVLQREVGRFTRPGRSQGCLTALVAAILAFLGLWWRFTWRDNLEGGRSDIPDQNAFELLAALASVTPHQT